MPLTVDKELPKSKPELRAIVTFGPKLKVPPPDEVMFFVPLLMAIVPKPVIEARPPLAFIFPPLEAKFRKKLFKFNYCIENP